MRRIVFMMIMLAATVCMAAACSRSDDVPKTRADIYYVDAEINRLLPYETEIIDADSEHMAYEALDKLISGRDNNEKIRQLLPNDRSCVSVRVFDNTAYVDLNSKIKENVPFSPDIEKLIIYQITNTLTSIKGIRFVRFTVDGEVHKDFMGFYDMRQTYKFQYPE